MPLEESSHHIFLLREKGFGFIQKIKDSKDLNCMFMFNYTIKLPFIEKVMI